MTTRITEVTDLLDTQKIRWLYDLHRHPKCFEFYLHVISVAVMNAVRDSKQSDCIPVAVTFPSQIVRITQMTDLLDPNKIAAAK